MQPLPRDLAHRHPTLAVALADDADLQAGQVDPIRVEPGQLADPQPAGVQQLQDGRVADAARLGERRRVQDARHLVGVEHVGQVAAGSRAVEQRRHVSAGDPLAQGEAVEAADGGHLARLGARPSPVASQPVHELGHRLRVAAPARARRRARTGPGHAGRRPPSVATGHAPPEAPAGRRRSPRAECWTMATATWVARRSSGRRAQQGIGRGARLVAGALAGQHGGQLA